MRPIFSRFQNVERRDFRQAAPGPSQPSPAKSRWRGRSLRGLGLVLLGVSVAVVSAGLAMGMAPAANRGRSRHRVVEFRIAYPRGTAGNPPGATAPGSTHELTFNPRAPDAIWITGQNEAEVVRLGLQGQETFFPMPVGSGPHGIVFNRQGQLWVTLEFAGELVRLNSHGKIVQQVHLPRDCPSCGSGVAPGPHGLAVGPDGRTLWYTGKEASVI
jgi:hypothetical protein